MRRKHALTIDLHHAGTAVASRFHALLVAKMGDLNAFTLGDLDQGLIGFARDLGTVELECHDWRLKLGHFVSGNCVHDVSQCASVADLANQTSSCGKYLTTQSTGLGAACPKPQIDASRMTVERSASSSRFHLGCSI